MFPRPVSSFFVFFDSSTAPAWSALVIWGPRSRLLLKCPICKNPILSVIFGWRKRVSVEICSAKFSESLVSPCIYVSSAIRDRGEKFVESFRRFPSFFWFSDSVCNLGDFSNFFENFRFFETFRNAIKRCFEVV